MQTFSKQKFLSLTLKRQHKKAGEHLRDLFEKNLPIDIQYQNMEEWLGLPPLVLFSSIKDRFHLHMKNAAVELKEHNLLVNRFDTLDGDPFGKVHIYLEDLRSAFNIGNILRTTEAFRLGTIVFSKDMPDNRHPKVVKTAMGTASQVPCKQRDLHDCPRPFIALETQESAPPLFEFDFPSLFTLLIGNEERGLKASTLEMCDYSVQIPLCGSKNSLNVASAFAIASFSIKNALRNC
ncbi:MAG: TrmH family RNA methyltransferase [Simkaniaceae bacterium]|nr:TrmH family RNA methyltransferase [Simkaniaceae bacterium]